MPPSSDQLREYLGSDESLEAVYTATLSEHSASKTVSVGLTDRRLFYLSDDGWFANVGYDAISAIRSRPQVTQSYRINDYRLVLGAGGVVAVLGFVGIVVFTSTLTVPFLVLAALLGLVSAEYIRRTAGASVGGVAEVTDRIEEFEARQSLRRLKNDVTGCANLHHSLMFGSGFFALLSFVGIVLLASSGGVFLGIFLFLGGIGIADYAYRHRAEFDGFDINRHHRTEVRITTDDDRTIYIRVDASEDLCQHLSRVLFSETPEFA